MTHVPPDVRDPVAAATACSQCQNDHCPALVSSWPIVPKIVWRDPPPLPDDGEGQEA